ncbi:MAG: type secretion system outer rane channel protein PorV [Bacteroidota bacterium]|jgi:hypothetical protein
MNSFVSKGFVLSLFSFSTIAFGQITDPSELAGQQLAEARPISTAVPFLNITPDARHGAMADVGVATTPDANSAHWNIGALSFIDKGYGASISYNPWLRTLVNDMALSNVSGYYKLSKQEVISLSMQYFDMGSIQFTDNSGNNLNKFSPNEFAIAPSYSRKLSDNLGIGVSIKYIYSNLVGSITTSGSNEPGKPGQSAAADVGAYYTMPINVQGAKDKLSFGLNISNVGARISYSNDSQRDYLPANLRLGTSFTHEIDLYNKVTFSLDANKLMVPSQPVYFKSVNSSTQNADSVLNGNKVIAYGKNPDRPLFSSIFGSFNDAPGGFSEEMKEFTLAGGVEYLYNNVFAIRGGYFNESKLKGNRKYMTIGFGFKYQVFNLDIAYLTSFQQNNPLANTLRFTLGFNFDKESKSVTQ